MFQNIVAVEVVAGNIISIDFDMEVLGIAHRVKYVALGSGLAMTAWSHIKLARSGSKLSPADKACTAFAFVMFLPSWGRNPWLAKVFIMGQGPRTVETVSIS